MIKMRARTATLRGPVTCCSTEFLCAASCRCRFILACPIVPLTPPQTPPPATPSITTLSRAREDSSDSFVHELPTVLLHIRVSGGGEIINPAKNCGRKSSLKCNRCLGRNVRISNAKLKVEALARFWTLHRRLRPILAIGISQRAIVFGQ
jgi:hypothetical protein